MISDLSAALSLLNQIADFSKTLDSRVWTAPNERFHNSTLGQHIRHCLEHFEALLNVTPEGNIDYDSRLRDIRIESSPQVAGERAEELGRRLSEMAKNSGPDRPVNVRTSCSMDKELRLQPSSFGRELQFLVSHTVHHFAIIAAICHGHDIALPENFGVAPSTLKYRETVAQD